MLGSNFYEGLTCLFGENPAIPTHCWSPNTLVCILPPATNPGPVVVSFKEHPLVVDGQDVVLFTYFDESDRALMELALQVVGLKMTGKLEDARQIAMRIVQGDNGGNGGNSGNGGTTHSGTTHSGGNTMQNSASASPTTPTGQTRDRRQELERQIIQALDVMETFETEHLGDISHPNCHQHTMLHLAAMLGFERLCRVLIDLGIDLNRVDNNGFTGLHYAAWMGRTDIVKLLLDAGAADNLTTVHDKLPIELARSRSFHDVVTLLDTRHRLDSEDGSAYAASSEAEVTGWSGDSEDDGDDDDDDEDEEEEEWEAESMESEDDVIDNGSSLSDTTSGVRPPTPRQLNRRRTSDKVDKADKVVNWIERGSADEIVDAVKLEASELDDSDDEVARKPKSYSDLAATSTMWVQRTLSHLQQMGKKPNDTMETPDSFMKKPPSYSVMNFAMPSMPSMPYLHLDYNMFLNMALLTNVANVSLPSMNLPTLIPSSFPPSFVSSNGRLQKEVFANSDVQPENSAWYIAASNLPSGADGSKKNHLPPRKQHHHSQYPSADDMWKKEEYLSWTRAASRMVNTDDLPFVPMDLANTIGEGSAVAAVAVAAAAEVVGGAPMGARVKYHGLEIMDEHKYQVHREKQKKLKQDKRLYLFWVPMLLGKSWFQFVYSGWLFHVYIVIACFNMFMILLLSSNGGFVDPPVHGQSQPCCGVFTWFH